MIRPPLGTCADITRTASRAQTSAPSTLVRQVACHCSSSISPTVAEGPNTPALLNSTSIRPNAATAAANNAATDAAFVTSVGTTTAFGRFPPDSASDSGRRPANTTRCPASSRARAAARPMPPPAPVITTTLFTRPIVSHPTGIRPCPPIRTGKDSDRCRHTKPGCPRPSRHGAYCAERCGLGDQHPGRRRPPHVGHRHSAGCQRPAPVTTLLHIEGHPNTMRVPLCRWRHRLRR